MTHSPVPVPHRPEVDAIRCSTCDTLLGFHQEATTAEVLAGVRADHDRHCTGPTRCTCGSWATRNRACVCCGRVVVEGYRWVA